MYDSLQGMPYFDQLLVYCFHLIARPCVLFIFQEVLDSLREKGFITIFVPANCTSELQPLDVAVNAPFKFLLKERFNDWFSDQVCAAIKKHPSDEKKVAAEVALDLRLCVIKPVHARWMIDAFAQLETKVLLFMNALSVLCSTDSVTVAALSYTYRR